ncbi:hypothetical protein [Scytonema hofmannii]|nr:hypothetical protein [Scytonema hofmannii]
MAVSAAETPELSRSTGISVDQLITKIVIGRETVIQENAHNPFPESV